MNPQSYKSICFILLAVLGYSVFSHYNTGSNYTDTCFEIWAAVENNDTRFQQVLGKRLASECYYRMQQQIDMCGG